MAWSLRDIPDLSGKVFVRDRITLADHAATLLLRDEFVRLMQALLGRLKQFDTPARQLDFMRSLSGEIADERFAPGNVTLIPISVLHALHNGGGSVDAPRRLCNG